MHLKFLVIISCFLITGNLFSSQAETVDISGPGPKAAEFWNKVSIHNIKKIRDAQTIDALLQALKYEELRATWYATYNSCSKNPAERARIGAKHLEEAKLFAALSDKIKQTRFAKLAINVDEIAASSCEVKLLPESALYVANQAVERYYLVNRSSLGIWI